MSTIPVAFDRSFVHDGHRLVYDVYGEGDQVVIYTHGLLIDSDVNRGIAQALAEQGDRVVLLDLLGHGRSDKPIRATDYRIDSYADQVIGLMDELGLDQAVLGGISLGANVSLFAAARYPGRVRALVLEMPVLERAVPASALLFSPLILLAHYGRRVMRVISNLVARAPRTRFGPLNSVLGAASLSPETVAAVLHGVLVGPVAPTEEQRRAITAPALVLAHRNDLIHPFDDASNLVEQLPRAVLVRAHSPMELRLRPQRLTHEIVTFLGDLRPARKRPRPSRSASR
ncbi:MAG TPA: alpha/beta hydrolase [Acidimicrobiia bacterium]